MSSSDLPIENVNGDSKALKESTVLRKIEFVCLDLIRQLSSKNLPSRLVLRTEEDDANKQIVISSTRGLRFAYFMQCLAQIYRLIINGQQSTKRDLYYERKVLYRTQANLNRTITAICDFLDEPRIALNVSKGMLSGALAFMTNEQKLVDCRDQQVLISESLTNFRVISDVQFIVVVEKDAIFQKLIDEGYFAAFPKSLLVTGKGYPDICTRKVLRWLVEKLNVPVYGLFDSDPHGIEIMLTFKYGSITERREGRGCNVKQIQWLGLKPSDVSSLSIPREQFIRLTNRDFMKIVKIRRRANGLGEDEVVAELDLLRLQRTKLELEAVSSIAPQYIIRGYLMSRLSSSPTPSCGTILFQDGCGVRNERQQQTLFRFEVQFD
uniref:DNA topoisomerase (ATP-hydrolyzing) n=1 Tax=Haemonchus contortus TaxID=6289 RepID=A0A7I4YLE4_HAECO